MLKPARANSWTVASCSEPFRDAELERHPRRLRPQSASHRVVEKQLRVAGVAHVAVAQPRRPARAPCRRRSRRGCAGPRAGCPTSRPSSRASARAAEEGDVARFAASASSASSFMKPTISTSPLSSSWTTAGMSPSSFEKSIVAFLDRVVLLPGSQVCREPWLAAATGPARIRAVQSPPGPASCGMALEEELVRRQRAQHRRTARMAVMMMAMGEGLRERHGGLRIRGIGKLSIRGPEARREDPL